MENSNSENAVAAPPMEAPTVILALVATAAVVLLSGFTAMEMIGTTLKPVTVAAPHTPPTTG